MRTVPYTHLDVYKRQVLDIEEDETKQLINDMQTAIDRESLDRTEFEQLMGRVTEKL